MKKWLIVLAVVAVLAGAVNAWWFGWTAYLEAQWRASAERLEAKYEGVDLISVRVFRGRELAVIVDPLERVAEIAERVYVPYVIFAMRAIGEPPTDEETELIAADCMAEAERLYGEPVKVILIFVGEGLFGGYEIFGYAELHSSQDAPALAERYMPGWGLPFPDVYVLFPGRE